MSLKNRILLEGKIKELSSYPIKKHIDWLKTTLDIVEGIDKQYTEVKGELEKDYKLSNEKIECQFMWDNQNDTYKWYDIEIKAKIDTKENLTKKVKDFFGQYKTYMSDCTCEDGELFIWFVIK